MRRKPRAPLQARRLSVNSSSCMRAHQNLAHAAFVPSCACAETFLTALPIDERAQSTQACGSAVAHHDAQHFLRVETARACSTMRRAGIVRNAIRGVFTMTCVQNQLLGACGCEYAPGLSCTSARAYFHCTRLYLVTTAAPQRAYSAGVGVELRG